MEQKVKRMLWHSLFSVFGVLVKVQGQLCNCLRQYSHAGIHNSMLHGTSVVHTLAAVRSSEEVGVGRAVVAVGGLISAFEKSFENAHGNQLLSEGCFFGADVV